MLISAGLVLLGLVLLVVGGDWLVRGASGMALLARLTPAVVGLTVVAAGTSMPEMVVSVQSSLAGKPDLSMGNIVGSNIFNVAAILGIAALIRPLSIQGSTVRMEWPVMFLSSFLLLVLARDGVIDRVEAGLFLVGMVTFTAYAVYLARRTLTVEKAEFEEEMVTASFGRTGSKAWVFNLLAVLVGVGLLIGGSTALVKGAVDIALHFGVSEAVVGLTVVAAGTSLPELATSVMAGLRGRDDIAVTNVVGSNIFNILGILGVAGTIKPLPVSAEILSRDMYWMLGVALLLFPLMFTGRRINRLEGALLLGTYLTYLVLLIKSQLG
jgi:cation:H+ antiporter